MDNRMCSLSAVVFFFLELNILSLVRKYIRSEAFLFREPTPFFIKESHCSFGAAT